MQIVFSDQPLPAQQVKSIFLAGPSPRAGDIQDWRPQAIRLLQETGFDGTVFVPIPSYRFDQAFARTEQPGWSYENQVAWEVAARQMSDVIAFWVPRIVDTSRSDLGMPAFTTNFEMGEDLGTGRVRYGRPADAVKCSYLDDRARQKRLTVFDSLDALLRDCVAALGEGALRQGGESRVPLQIWQTEYFQQWYANLKAAGNRLDDAKVVSTAHAASGPLFAFILWVKVWVESEQRYKANEVVVSRKDAAAVFAFTRNEGEARIALVKEFRSPVSNTEGFVYELPGGSSFKPNEDPLRCASAELHEETGLPLLEPARFSQVALRQLAATFSTHRASVFAVELRPEEFAHLEQAQAQNAYFGENPLADNAERTYVRTCSVSELMSLPVDYSTLGMVFECLVKLGLLKV